MDFDRIDINQCPKGKGNNGPNRFANTARCKTETTEVIHFCIIINSIVVLIISLYSIYLFVQH